MPSTAVSALRFTRGLRRLVRHPVPYEVARDTVRSDLANRESLLLRSLDELVLPFPSSPTRQLLEVAGIERGDVARLLDDHGLDGALGVLRDAGVYVAYEEYQGHVPATRGSATLEFSPPAFFNPVQRADFLGATGGSRGAPTQLELSFAYERRQAMLRLLQYELYGVRKAPTATWAPVFPSAAGFGATVKAAAAGNAPERWFSQVAAVTEGVTSHKRRFNQVFPALNAIARTGLPVPEHVPTSSASVVVDWFQDALRRDGRALIGGYASSITAAARYAIDHGIDLTGVVAMPASEPVTTAKLNVMRAAGMRPCPLYAFMPEGGIAIGCPHTPDETYHLWDHDLAAITRRRQRSDGLDIDAFVWTSLSREAPRVMLNVENDDYGRITRDDQPCECLLGQLGVRTRISDVRGVSKVVAAGITLEGELFDEIVEHALPARLGGGPGDYQFVEDELDGRARVTLRVHPDVGAIDESAAIATVLDVLRKTDNGVLAAEVWSPAGVLRVQREVPLLTPAGKCLSYERVLRGGVGAEARKVN
jgi:hypothetical protein